MKALADPNRAAQVGIALVDIEGEVGVRTLGKSIAKVYVRVRVFRI